MSWLAFTIAVFLTALICSTPAKAQQSSLSADLSDGVLTISGNSEDDSLHPLVATISQSVVSVYSSGGSFSETFDVADVSVVNFVLGAGPDALWLSLAGQADVNIDTGLDDDQIVIWHPGSPPPHQGNLFINTGQGFDQVTFSEIVRIHGDTTIVTGQGSDRVHFGSAFWTNYSGNLFDFDGNLSISTGTNGDSVTMENASVHISGDLSASGGQGDDWFWFVPDPPFGNYLAVDGTARFFGDQGTDILAFDLFDIGTLETVGIEVVDLPDE